MLSQGHMGAALFRYTGQVAPKFGDSGSLEEWKWCHKVMVEADIHFRPLHKSIVDICKVFETLVCCLKGIWMHPYSIALAGWPQIRGLRGSLEEWKWCDNVMVEADIHAHLITIVSWECPHRFSTPTGKPSPRSNIAYQPAFPCKGSCQGSINCTPWTCDCDDTLWAWCCWAHPYWPQTLQVWQCC